jgi:hypothetical protein
MPHEIVIDGERRTLGEVTTIGRGAAAPLLRAHRSARGDAVIITTRAATRDGLPVVGNLTVVGWGESAIVRVADDLKIDVVWRAAARRSTAGASRSCRLCFAAWAPGETATSCPGCEACFHVDCNRAQIHCPGCGASRTEA